ncbi:MAG: hypothetical protein HYV28_15290 [Ignavibacteriales bacterium]|nr:hypothetical protein [Ignavibacteriales bacterium]
MPHKNRLRQVVYVTVILAVILLSGCRKDKNDTVIDPPVVNGSITLAAESVRFTEAWIQVSIKDHALPSMATVIAGSREKIHYLQNSKDTVIYIDSLEAGTTNIIGVAIGEGTDTIKSALQIQTLPFTSHNITWEEYTLGDFSSELNAVWGTDDNNVYAVGYIIEGDSIYSLLHFDGNKWNYLHDKVGGYSIHGLADNDIWLAGGGVFHKENNQWEQLDSKRIANQIQVKDSVLFKGTPYTNCWGTASDNMYFTSHWGRLIHWDGKKGNVENTPYTERLTDVWGVAKDNIIACGGTLLSNSHKVLRYNGLEWNYEKVSSATTGETYFAVYGVSKHEYYIAGTRVFGYKNGKWSVVMNNPKGMLHGCRGNKETGEIVAVGDFSTIIHFNGKDWYDFGKQLGQDPSPLTSVYIGKKKIIAVGYNTQLRAKIYVGTKH